MILTPPTIFTSANDRPSRPPRSSRRRNWTVGAMVIIGLVVGITTYRNSQPDLDSLDRFSIPGTVALHVDEPTSRVVYYEGAHSIRYSDLTITVTDREGRPVRVVRNDQMILETLGLVRDRALAAFNPRTAGDYRITVGGIDSGQFVVGPSVSRRTLPGVLAGLVLAGLSIAAAFVLRTPRRGTTGREGAAACGCRSL